LKIDGGYFVYGKCKAVITTFNPVASVKYFSLTPEFNYFFTKRTDIFYVLQSF
jgi:hypothetical protein